MNLARRALRRAFFPLVAIVGVALLVLGYFEWRRFFADLYREEVAAIEAAVQAGLEVEYRREGEPRPRIALRRLDWLGQEVETEWDRAVAQVPDNAPFLGRVESVVLRSPRYASAAPPSEEVRDGLLRLPGMRSLDLEGNDDFERGWVIPLAEAAEGEGAYSRARAFEQALGMPLPAKPERRLTVEQATAPLPRGTPLGATERESLAAEIASAWKRERARDAYVARSWWRPADEDDCTVVVTEVADGPRFASRIEIETTLDPEVAASVAGNVAHFDDLRLIDGQQAHALQYFYGAWRRTATFAERGEDVRATYQERRFGPYLLAPRALPLLAEPFDGSIRSDPLEPDGKNVAAVERIDDRRLRVELASKPMQDAFMVVRFEMIVREDFDYAVEHALTTIESTPGSPTARFRSELALLRRLDRVGEAVFSQETLRISRSYAAAAGQPELTLDYEHAERTLTTIVETQDVPRALFDPRTYDPTPWPEPRALPVVRSYRLLWPAGALLIAIGLFGPLFARRGSPKRTSEKGDDERPVEAEHRAPRLRFGLATLLAAALGLISVAGAIKQSRDEVARDVALLASLDGAAQFERREPRFPWSLFSTPAFPIDAPVERIVVSAVSDDESDANAVPSDAARRLLASPDLDSFVDASDPGPPAQTNVLDEAENALGRELPKLPWSKRPPETALWLEEMPKGEPIERGAREELVARMIAGWRAMREKAPSRWLLVESHDHYGDPEERTTLRDGERVWSLGGRGTFAVTTDDGEYRYRFRPRGDGGASLVERTRRGTDAMAWSHFSDVELYGTATPAGGIRIRDGRESLFAIDRPGTFPDPPYAFSMHLYADVENFQAVAQAALDPTRIVRVARVDDERVRVDFAPVEVDLSQDPPLVSANPTDEGAPETSDGDAVWEDEAWNLNFAGDPNAAKPSVKVEVSDLAIVVREDLDFAVERSVATTKATRNFDGALQLSIPAYSASPPKRRSYLFNQLVRANEGLVVPESARAADRDGARTWWDSRYGYDLAPEFDERIFASPSMDDLLLVPVPERRWTVTWPFVTGAVSLATLLALGGKRAAGAIRGRRRSFVGQASPDDSGDPSTRQ